MSETKTWEPRPTGPPAIRVPSLRAAEWAVKGPLQSLSGGMERAMRFQRWVDSEPRHCKAEKSAEFRAAWTAYQNSTRLALVHR